VRTFQPGDEAGLTELFHQAYAAYVGPEHPTTRQWEWPHTLNAPVYPDGILIAESEGRMNACAIVTQSGVCTDLFIHPQTDREATLAQLLPHIQRYVVAHAAEQLFLPALPEDESMTRATATLGYIPHYRYLVAKVLNFAELLRHVIEENLLSRNKAIREQVLIRIRRRETTSASARTTEPLLCCIDHQTLSLRPATQHDNPGITITTDAVTLSKIIFRLQSINGAIFSRKLTIAPLHKTPAAARFLSLTVLPRPWCTRAVNEI
jgi:hypothetical protein